MSHTCSWRPAWTWHRNRYLLLAAEGLPSAYILSELISIKPGMSIKRQHSWADWVLFCFFLLNFLFEIIVDSHDAVRNNAERCWVAFPSLPGGHSLQTCNMLYQDIDIGTEHLHHHKGPSCCPLITTLSSWFLTSGNHSSVLHFYNFAFLRKSLFHFWRIMLLI